MFKKNTFFIIVLILINFIAHFIPFERASIGPDDYTMLFTLKTDKPNGLIPYLLRYHDRPVNFITFDLQFNLTKDDPFKGLIFTFLVSILTLILVFILFKELSGDSAFAFLASLIFTILPHKLEVFQYPVDAQSQVMTLFFIFSIIFGIYYFKQNKLKYLFLSLLTYGLGLFGYEVGFFIPVIICLYPYFSENLKKRTSVIFGYLFIAVIYGAYRTTSVFGLLNNSLSRRINFSLAPFVDLFHQYFGRYIIRNFLYGIYKFVFMPPTLLALFVVVDILCLYFLYIFLKRYKDYKINRNLLFFSAIIFIFSIAPIFLYGTGGIAGRHLIIPSIGISIFLLWLIKKIGGSGKAVFIVLIGILLIVCQGNAWTQVIASRLNGAVYETIKEKKGELTKAKYIIFDVKSFTDNIPYTWKKEDYNQLNTYYGAQAFEDWGLSNMVRLVTHDQNKSVFFSTGSIKVNNGFVEFIVTKLQGYRKVFKERMLLPFKETEIIDFGMVFSGGFNNGIRKK